MIKTLVVQSPKNRRDNLNAWCESQFFGRCEPMCAETTEEAIKVIRLEKPQLVIVDIAPEAGVCFQLFEATNSLKYDKIVICESGEFAIKALRYNVGDYLLKPLEGKQLIFAIERLLFEKKENKIQQLYDAKFKQSGLIRLSSAVLQTNSGEKLIHLASIVRVKDMGDHCVLHLISGKRMYCSYDIDKLQLLFNGSGLVRIDRETIVSARHIVKFWSENDTPWVRLVDGYQAGLGFRAEHFIKKYYSQQLPEAPSLGYVSNC